MPSRSGYLEATRTLSKFVAETGIDDIPQQAIHQAKRLILDTIGCTLGGGLTEIASISANYVRSLGGIPESTVIGCNFKTSCTNAVYANVSVGNALDADDCFPWGTHYGNCVVHASLSTCEREKASGSDLLTSVIVGHDVGSRILVSMPVDEDLGAARESYSSYSGFHGMGTANMTFCAAGGACKALKLDEEKVAHALGIAGANVPLPTMIHQWNKSYPNPPLCKGFAGWCSQLGVTAALLAKCGLTSFNTILDGDNGFCKLYGAPSCDFDRMLADLGEKWYIRYSYLKPWPSCRWHHYPLTAFLKIVEENHLKPDDIRKVIVHAGKGISAIRDPKDFIASSLISMPHIIAMGALGVESGPDWHSQETITNAKVKEFRKKVIVEEDEKLEEKVKITDGEVRREYPCVVEVYTAKGVFTQSTKYARGDPWNGFNMSQQDVEDKFRHFSSKAKLSANWQERIEKIIETVNNLEDLKEIDELTRLLRRA